MKEDRKFAPYKDFVEQANFNDPTIYEKAANDSARDVADTIVFMDDGKIVQQGSPEKILVNPTNPRIQSFLSRFRRN